MLTHDEQGPAPPVERRRASNRAARTRRVRVRGPPGDPRARRQGGRAAGRPARRRRIAARSRRPLQLGARGCRLVVRNLKLYRDIHYTQYGEHGTRRRRPRFGPDEYFVLGDNSGNSQDSRKWPPPGVPEADFIGKPFLIHQPLRPARVTVGGRERVFQTVDWSRLRWLH